MMSSVVSAIPIADPLGAWCRPRLCADPDSSGRLLSVVRRAAIWSARSTQRAPAAPVRAARILTGPGSDPHGPEDESLVDHDRRAADGHPNWDEYRSAMVSDRRVL